MANCKLCSNKIDRSDENKVKCVVCCYLFHTDCVNMNASDLEYIIKQKLPWKCNSCLENARKFNNSSPCSPTHATIRNISSESVSQLKLKETRIINNVKKPEDDNASLSAIIKKLTQIETQNNLLNSNINNLNSEISNILSRVESIQNVVKSLQSNLSENKVKINELQSQINENKTLCVNNSLECEKRIDLLERQLIKNNIEIHNVPFTSKENLREIVLKLCVNSLQVDIDNRSIDTCYRKKVIIKMIVIYQLL